MKSSSNEIKSWKFRKNPPPSLSIDRKNSNGRLIENGRVKHSSRIMINVIWKESRIERNQTRQGGRGKKRLSERGREGKRPRVTSCRASNQKPGKWRNATVEESPRSFVFHRKTEPGGSKACVRL